MRPGGRAPGFSITSERAAHAARHETQVSASYATSTARIPRSAAAWSHPVQQLNDTTEVELVRKRQPRRIRDPERQVRMHGRRECLRGERDHRVRGVDTNHRAAWQAAGDLAGDLAITAANVEDALVTVEW
jgi:hypothetical protein